MANNYKYQMTFDMNHRNEIIIEDAESINKTLLDTHDTSQNFNIVFFGEEYKMALNVIKEFVFVANKRKDKKNVNADLGGCFDSINNIVIFTGERGSGKTSAMLSFGDYLCNNDLEKKALPNVRFWHLPMIDPSLFDDNRNILLTVLSIMLEKAKQIQENCDKIRADENDSIYFDLLRQIQRVFNMVGHLNVKPDGKKYDLEYLNELGDVSRLKDEMRVLIDKYLKFISPRADFLVLMVDDLDMNTEYAPQMLEQIQKFLMIDNLIILMAANMDQLQNEMTEHYSKSFSYTIKSGERKIAPMDVEDIATKYLLKIFPATSRIHLGNGASKLLQTSAKIVQMDGKIEGGKIVGLQRFILNAIWQKTHLLFVPKNDNQLHPIIPRNLRDLHQFVNLLLDLEDVERDGEDAAKFFQSKKEYDTVYRNFLKFKDYIMHTWIPYHLSYDQQMLFDKIPEEITEVNKYLIQIINTVANEYKRKRNITDIKKENNNYSFVSYDDDKAYITNNVSRIMNVPSNVSMGDLLLIIDRYSIYFEGTEGFDFMEAIKVYYSMLLFEITFYYSPIKLVKIDNVDELININDLGIDKTTEIQQLVAGTFYNPRYFGLVGGRFYYDGLNDEYIYYHKSKVGSSYTPMEVMFWLYYGSDRPLRHLNKHIYDTCDNADLDSMSVRFDLLGLIENLTNPYQVIYRFIGNHKDVINSVLEKTRVECALKLAGSINVWLSKSLSLNENENVLPFIFPFYSIDMMLLLLNFGWIIDEAGKIRFNAGVVSMSAENVRNQFDNRGFKSSVDYVLNPIKDVEKKSRMRKYSNVIDFALRDTGAKGYDETVGRNTIINEERNWKEVVKDCVMTDTNKYIKNVCTAVECIYTGNDLSTIKEKIISKSKEGNCKKSIVDLLIREFIDDLYKPTNKTYNDEMRTLGMIKAYYLRVGDLLKKSVKYVDVDGEEIITNLYASIFNTGTNIFINEFINEDDEI